MDTTRWLRLEELFEQGRELPPEEREAYLARACPDDESLANELRRLLTADDDGAGSIEPPTRGELETSLAPPPEVGRRIGPYELQREIGRGGMATVYLARRVDEHFEKDVALKLIRRGMDTDDIVERFRNERQVLAGLEHPGIARLLDGGATDDGLPFLVMEYVDGKPLDAYCDENELSVRERVQLVRRVCDAIQHAHDQQVVHRDLKPTNVLVAADGTPKLLDFGIAKLLDRTGTVHTVDITVTELRLMTPEYASPEQIRGERITASTDVYSLGVILFELLTGHRPYGERVASRGELERKICDEDAPRASSIAGRTRGDRPPSSRRSTTTRGLQRELAGDLDNVIAMALRKEPARRYRSAGALADDLGRWLRGETMLARPSTWTYRAGKFVRRHRVLVASSAAVFVSLVAGIAISLSLYFAGERRRAEAVHRMYVAHVAAAAGSLRNGDAADARRNLELAPAEHRGWEWRHLWAQSDESVLTLSSASSHVALSWSGDGRRLATSAIEAGVTLWDAITGEVIAHWPDLGGINGTVALAPDGERLVAFVWDVGVVGLHVDDPGPRWTAPGSRGQIELDPEGERVVYTDPGSVSVLDADDGTELGTLEWPGGDLLRATFDAGGERVLFVSRTGLIGEWNLADGSSRVVADAGEILGPQHRVEFKGFDSDGRVAVTGSTDGALRVWDVASGELVREIAAHGERVFAAQLDADGRRVATTSIDRLTRVWSVETGRLLRTFLGHRLKTSDAAFRPDGRMLATTSSDGTSKLWDLGPERASALALERGWSLAVAFDTAGRRLAVATWGSWQGIDRGVDLLDVGTRTTLWRRVEDMPAAEGQRNDAVLAWSPDGSRVYGSHANGEILVWNADDGRVLDRWPVEGGLVPLAFTPDGSALALGRECIRLVDPESGDELARFDGPGGDIQKLAFHPDGALLATISDGNRAHIWDVATGEELAQFEDNTYDVAFHPDGERFATAGVSRVVLWSVATFEPIRTWEGHSANVRDLVFNADGDRLFSACVDKSVKVWDPEFDVEIATLHGHETSVDALALSPDGTLLVSQDRSGVLRFWSAPEE